ncbi:Hsp20/alpha crystallin family protein [Methanoculleus sp. FWC-SCC1]|uniref:Hsp20/alpha crystallin family protein n=1 Tax=Methanoculleus frigidifontis TaxID=2584085 RepID=A0ABT8M703_9EURY|nr:Hsp20/alpha crystallin family protein [Methanoculleus sp. FWC-SCC1]MDN7023705.1 Hsp20/alpha crystallin family protein [Methanoculleus sp. FWC-SCC1]
MGEKESSAGLRKDIDATVSEMQRRLQEMMAGAEKAGQQIMTAVPVDVRELDDTVMVVADLPGVKREDVAVRLLGHKTLRITARRKGTAEEAEKGYVVRERVTGEMTRTVNLPADVSEKGATAAFRDGVLTVRLQKTPEEQGIEIPVGEEAGSASSEEADTAAALRRQKEEEYEEGKRKLGEA